MIDKEIVSWLQERKVVEVEAMFADFNGILRGKIVPTEKYVLGPIKLPESVIAQSVTGDWKFQIDYLDDTDNDMQLVPDPGSCFPIPWSPADEPAAQVICDCYTLRNRPVQHTPRYLLKKVLGLYRRQGWTPVVAPEIEFYFVAHDTNPDNPLTAPVGRSEWPVSGQQAYSIDAVNEYERIVNDIYMFAEAQDLDIDTLNNEEGIAQMEINFNHGDPLKMADHVVMFKRCVREAALRHGVRATFMAKPVQGQPGSSLHIHQSVVDRDGRNILAKPDGSDGPLLMSYIGGLQRYARELQAIYMPNINSYRRLNTPYAGINTQWGVNNRTVGFRIPAGDQPESKRVENRLSGADVNPYLAIAASLLSGYRGMVEKARPGEECRSAGWDRPLGLSGSLIEATLALQQSKMLREACGGAFVNLYGAVRRTEFEHYRKVVSSWERMFLLQMV